jgi:FkbM family methyltransferase
MSYQRVLARLASSRFMGEAGRALAKRRAWKIESGPGAGLRMRLPQNEEFVRGTSELPVQRAISAQLGRGDVFYDVGANVGFFSLIAARQVGAQGRVCAFEPHPSNAVAVRANARLNGMDQVDVFEVAAGRASRTDELVMTDWDGGAVLAGYPTGPSATVARVAVSVIALDEYVVQRQLPLPDLVKIDVEGAEGEVLQGMRSLIQQARPVLVYEIDDGERRRFDARWDDLDEAVAAMGYRVRRLEPSYPGLAWHVGHSLAVPVAPRRGGSGRADALASRTGGPSSFEAA